jgi:hypothetical protein
MVGLQLVEAVDDLLLEGRVLDRLAFGGAVYTPMMCDDVSRP